MTTTTDMQALGERLHLLLSGDAILAKTDFARSTIEQAIAALASRPDAQADEVRAADPGDELQGWSVTVERNGVRLLTIEKDSVGGVENINDFAPLVRNCAEHLLSFIGRDAQAGERGAKLYRFIEAPEHILVGDEIWAQRSSEWQPVTPDFVDTEYSNWMPPIRRVVDQHEKSDLYKAGYLAGKKAAQESLSKLVSCDPNDEALGLICEALSLKPEGDITEAILGAIEELKTEAGVGAKGEPGSFIKSVQNLTFLCRTELKRLSDEMLKCIGEVEDHLVSMRVSIRDEDGELRAALSLDREQVGEVEADARRMRTLCRLLDAMDDLGNGFPGEVHAAFQDGAKHTREALDAQWMPGD